LQEESSEEKEGGEEEKGSEEEKSGKEEKGSEEEKSSKEEGVPEEKDQEVVLFEDADIKGSLLRLLFYSPLP
jgi:hypothetical protein